MNQLIVTLTVIVLLSMMHCLSLRCCVAKYGQPGALRCRKYSPIPCGPFEPTSPNQQLTGVLVKRFRQIGSVLVALAAVSAVFDRTKVVAAPTVEPFPIEGFKTPSGLVYFDMNAPDLQPTSNNSSFMYPAYGQFVSFYFTSYYLPSAEGKLQFIDATEPGAPFLQKHGNGRIIRGIEEALHTMTVGSRRRVIIPAQLGYSTFGLGPLPMEPSRRRKLGEVIGKVDRGEGSLVYDLELVHIRDDENDMGYYSDIPVSKEEVRDYVFRSRNITIPTTATIADSSD